MLWYCGRLSCHKVLNYITIRLASASALPPPCLPGFYDSQLLSGSWWHAQCMLRIADWKECITVENRKCRFVLLLVHAVQDICTSLDPALLNPNYIIWNYIRGSNSKLDVSCLLLNNQYNALFVMPRYTLLWCITSLVCEVAMWSVWGAYCSEVSGYLWCDETSSLLSHVLHSSGLHRAVYWSLLTYIWLMSIRPPRRSYMLLYTQLWGLLWHIY